MIIKQYSLMDNSLGLAGVVLAHQSGVYAAWTAHTSRNNYDMTYSILEMDYGLSIKIRSNPGNAKQVEKDIKEIIKHCMPDTEYKIEQDCNLVRVIKLTKGKQDDQQ